MQRAPAAVDNFSFHCALHSWWIYKYPTFEEIKFIRSIIYQAFHSYECQCVIWLQFYNYGCGEKGLENRPPTEWCFCVYCVQFSINWCLVYKTNEIIPFYKRPRDASWGHTSFAVAITLIFLDDHVVLVFWIALFGDGLTWKRDDHLTHHLQAKSPYFNWLPHRIACRVGFLRSAYLFSCHIYFQLLSQDRPWPPCNMVQSMFYVHLLLYDKPLCANRWSISSYR